MPHSERHAAGDHVADVGRDVGRSQGKRASQVLSPGKGSSQVVFTEEPEAISPLMLGKSKDVEAFSLDAANSGGSKHRIPKLMHKVSRRFSHLTASPSLRPTLLERTSSTNGPDVDAHVPAQIHQGLQETFMQMHEWIQDERAKRKTKGLARMPSNDGGWNSRTPMSYDGAYDGASHSAHDGGEMSDPLDRLEGILDKGMLLANIERSFLRKASLIPRRSSTFKRLRAQSTVGSDDNESDEGYVPTCEAILDNSKTLSFTGGASDSQSIQPDSKKVASKSKDAWTSFKYEILRLAHTLKLKGWRRVPFEMSDEIDVERLSGALTNAVYVVSPPPELPQKLSKASDSTTSLVPRKAPIKLLLRIYGPQSEHLIDRDAELQILRRLAKQHIGPSLLGTFTNGRFEEFLHARTLKPQDLRMPDTSKQIAKRMRELHDGIELLEEERDGGPFVWKNWDCWVERCEEVVQYLDKQVLTGDTHPRLARLKGESLICCVEWKVFQGVVEKFRAWLDERYGGASKLREQLIFAHNDTQYGNILRLVPPGESPLLLPANEHKQLVVIDFEYANANMVGFEFANHFSEWCYNYHDPDAPYACNTHHYPTPEEQARFIRAYVLHRPAYRAPSQTPRLTSTTEAQMPHLTRSLSSFSLDKHSSDIFSLDSRGPPPPLSAQVHDGVQAPDDPAVTAEVQRLMQETRLWRIACSAHWVAWGIVQANVSGEAGSGSSSSADADADKAHGCPGEGSAVYGHEQHRHLDPASGTDPLTPFAQAEALDLRDRRPEAEGAAEGVGDAEAEAEGSEHEEFDYLAYAQERAMLFWGDVLQLGLVKEEELPGGLRGKVKVLKY